MSRNGWPAGHEDAPRDHGRRGRARTLAVTVLGASTAGALALAAGPALAATHAAGSGCTDSWTNAAGGSWDTGTNWSTGVAPTSTDTACITRAGTYTVVLGNETLSTKGLVVGGSGATPTLQIGNGGSSYPHITVNGTVTVATGSTLSDGWGGTFDATEIDVTGTLVVPATGYPSSMSATRVENAGTFSAQGALAFSLPTTASLFDNTGTVSTAASTPLTLSSPSGQTGTFRQAGTIANSGSLSVADAVQISAGTICGTALVVGAGDGGAGGTLSFDQTVAAGPACSGAAVQDAIFVPNVTATIAGTIPAAYSVSIGDGGSSFAHVTLQGVTNAGRLAFGWGGTLTGPLTNTGTFTVSASSYSSTWSAGAIGNSGSVDVQAPLSIDLASGSTFTNTATGTVLTETGQRLAVASSSGSATVAQSGLVTNLGTFSVADAVQINGGTVCGNALSLGSGDGGTGGSLAFAPKPSKGPACAKKQPKDQIFIPNVTATIGSDIPKGWTVTIGDGGSSYAHVTLTGDTNAGVLAVGFGASLTDTAVLTNTGTLAVKASGYSTPLTFGGLVNNGKVTVAGPTTVDLGSGSWSTAAKKSVTVSPNVTVSVNRPTSNAGTLTLQGGAQLSVTQYTQTTAGTLAAVQAAHSEPTYLTVSGAAQLAGTVSVLPVKKFTATGGDQLTLVSAGSVSGTFATVKGTYTIAYAPTTVRATAH